jgi:hypothetical protein
MQSQHALALRYKPMTDYSEVITIREPIIWEWLAPPPQTSPPPDTPSPNIVYLRHSIATPQAIKSVGEIERDTTTTPARSVTHSRMSPVATMAMALSGFAAVGSFVAFGQVGVIATAGIVAIIAITLGLRDGKRLQ